MQVFRLHICYYGLLLSTFLFFQEKLSGSNMIFSGSALRFLPGAAYGVFIKIITGSDKQS
jgi:hypothetical protein